MRELKSIEVKNVSGGNPVIIGMGLGMIAGGISAAHNGAGFGGIARGMMLGGLISLTAGIAAVGSLGSVTFGFMGRLAQGANSIGLAVAAGAEESE